MSKRAAPVAAEGVGRRAQMKAGLGTAQMGRSRLSSAASVVERIGRAAVEVDQV